MSGVHTPCSPMQLCGAEDERTPQESSQQLCSFSSRPVPTLSASSSWGAAMASPETLLSALALRKRLLHLWTRHLPLQNGRLSLDLRVGSGDSGSLLSDSNPVLNFIFKKKLKSIHFFIAGCICGNSSFPATIQVSGIDLSSEDLYGKFFCFVSWGRICVFWKCLSICTPGRNVSIPGELLLPYSLYWFVIVVVAIIVVSIVVVVVVVTIIKKGSLNICTGCCETYSVDQDGLFNSSDPRDSASQVLRSVCLTLYWLSSQNLLSLWEPSLGKGLCCDLSSVPATPAEVEGETQSYQAVHFLTALERLSNCF